MQYAEEAALRAPGRVLSAGEPPAFEIFNAEARGRIVLVCEHAGRLLPKSLGTLGVAASELDRHIAYDIGAEGLSRRLAGELDAPAVLQPYSRLVIDCNRSLQAPDCIPEVSDTTVVPGNAGLSEDERLARYREIHMAFHEAVGRVLDGRTDPDRAVLVCVHSFTPRLLSTGLDRPWEIGLLYIRDDRLARRLMASMTALRPGLRAAFNEPYVGSDLTDYAIPVHGERRGIEHVLIEIRNDLIGEAAGQGEWAGFIGRAIRAAVGADGG